MDELKKQLLKFLKSNFIDLALKKLLATGGVRAWLVKYLASHLFDELVAPVILYTIRKGQLVYDKKTGAVIIGKINHAKENDDERAYTSSISDV
jgi:hypothetical protein